MSKLQRAEPTKDDDLQDFAFDLAEHCLSFNHHVEYKSFLQSLVRELADKLPKAEMDSLIKHVERFGEARAKEEKKVGKQNVSHRIVAHHESDDEDAPREFNVLEDFM